MMNWRKLEQMTALYHVGNSPQETKKLKDLKSALTKYQRRMKKHPTRAESRFKTILYEFFGFKGEKNRPRNKKARKIIKCQKIFVITTTHGVAKGYIVDFYLPKYKLAIEVDGDSHDDRKEYDSKRDNALKHYRGVKTLRISNTQTKDKCYCYELLKSATVYNWGADTTPKPKRQAIQIGREQELKMQADWMKTHKVTVLQSR